VKNASKGADLPLSEQDNVAVAGISALLRHAIGLDAASLGDRVLLACYRSAMAALQLESLPALLAACAVQPTQEPSQALRVLIEQVVVPESWFFRVLEQFEDLVHAARRHLAGHKRIRVLSLPCANGEEAYSIVMTLMDAGIAAEAIEVVAIDVSEHSIARAKRAVYRNSALRGQARHAQMLPINADEFQIAEVVRNRVRFICANFIDLSAQALGQFDAIFVRNLLIYLAQDARSTLLELIASVARSDAPIFSGHAELLPSISSRFSGLPDARSSLSFIKSEKQRAGAAPPKPLRSSTASAGKPVTTANVANAGQSRAPNHSQHVTVVASQDVFKTTMAHPAANTKLAALQLALDQGNLPAAKPLLQTLIAHTPTDPQVHYYSGLIALAEHQLAQADQAFKQCLYLARDHQDALAQRLLIAKRTGSAEAAILQARLQRLRAHPKARQSP
jgi:chemotaxis protein methyltransferase WspC